MLKAFLHQGGSSGQSFAGCLGYANPIFSSYPWDLAANTLGGIVLGCHDVFSNMPWWHRSGVMYYYRFSRGMTTFLRSQPRLVCFYAASYCHAAGLSPS
jgi:hypothetical protein